MYGSSFLHCPVITPGCAGKPRRKLVSRFVGCAPLLSVVCAITGGLVRLPEGIVSPSEYVPSGIEHSDSFYVFTVESDKSTDSLRPRACLVYRICGI